MSSLFSSSWFWQHPFTKAPSSIHAKGRGHQHWHTGEYQISTSNRYLESKVDEISSQSLSLQYVAVLILGMKLPSPPDMIMITVMMTRWNGQTSTTPTCIAVAWKLQRLLALNKTLSSFGAIRFLLLFAFDCFEPPKIGLCKIGPDRVDYCWDQGHYNENSDLKFEALTEEEILDTINNNNISGIFLKDFNFKELLGDVKYDAYGRIIGDYMICTF